MSRHESFPHSGLGRVFKSITKSFKPTNTRVPVAINAKVVGGAPDMEKLLQLLQQGLPRDRAAAANAVSAALSQFAVSSIPEIWYLANDLCDRSHPSVVRKAALKLMVLCTTHDTDDISNRLVYYRDIVKYSQIKEGDLDPHFALFFEALQALTANGQEIHDFCIYQDFNWFELILRSFNLTGLAATSKTKSLPEMFALLLEHCLYLSNCYKYSFSLIDAQFTATITEMLYSFSAMTEREETLLDFCQLINTIAIYGFIPTESNSQVVQLLCWYASFSPALHELALATLSKISAVSPSITLDAVMAVLQTLALNGFKGKDVDLAQLKPRDSYKPLLTALGALTVLEGLLMNSTANDLWYGLDFSNETLYWGLVKCVSLEIPLLNSGILRIFDHMFLVVDAEPNSESQKRFARLFPFHTWSSSSASVLHLLKLLEIHSAQDKSYWSSMVSSLFERLQSPDFAGPQDQIIELFLQHPGLLEIDIVKYVLNHYKEENKCTVLDPFWKDNCSTLLNSFYFPSDGNYPPTVVRTKTLEIIKDSVAKSWALSEDSTLAKDTILAILKSCFEEDDEAVLRHLVQVFLFELLRMAPMPLLLAILDVFLPLMEVETPIIQRPLISSRKSAGMVSRNMRSSIHTTVTENITTSKSSFLSSLAKTMSKAFVTLSVSSPERAKIVYDFLLDLTKYSIKTGNHSVALIFLRTFIRIRLTSKDEVYFTEPSEMNGLATTLKRNTSDSLYKKVALHWWTYPEEPEYLPRSHFNKPSIRLLILIQEQSAAANDNCFYLDISPWLGVVIEILNQAPHWELYTYVLAHFCSQLSNMKLFEHLSRQISEVQQIICAQLTLELPKNLVFPSSDNNINKPDVQIAHIRTLSSLLGYHRLLDDVAKDSIVSSLLFGLGSWQTTAIPCIHILTICCYELADSLKKFLAPILAKLQAGVTNMHASSPTLEFLMALVHVPSLTSNFTTDEFKRVIAISFRYIDHALDLERQASRSGTQHENTVQDHGIDAVVDEKVSTQGHAMTSVIHHYLLYLSYAVISKWFLQMDLTERAQLSSFVIKNILSCCKANGSNQMDDMTVAYMDLISRFTYSNLPLKIVQKPTSPHNGSTNRWLLGHSLVEINTNEMTGDSTISVRRPTGFTSFQVKLDPQMLATTTENKGSQAMALSDYFFLQLFRPLDQGGDLKPLVLLDDVYTERAISTFDRIPVIAHHKAGIIYIAPGQKDETEILANTVGSPDYYKFVDGLGQLIKLDASDSIYVGGLDKEGGTDGELTYFWSDEITQLVYHVTTMMPNAAGDKHFSMKKRHIGNNYVNVFFDDSGLPFNFNVIKSQYNFINIVISQHTISDCSSGVSQHKFYKVRTYRRSGVPGFFCTTHFKLISLSQLPTFIRNVVVLANRFADVWHNLVNGSFTTNWQKRVQHLAAIREKTLESYTQMEAEDLKAGVTASRSTAQSFLEQLQPETTDGGKSQNGSNENASKGNDLYSVLEFGP